MDSYALGFYFFMNTRDQGPEIGKEHLVGECTSRSEEFHDKGVCTRRHLVCLMTVVAHRVIRGARDPRLPWVQATLMPSIAAAVN